MIKTYCPGEGWRHAARLAARIARTAHAPRSDSVHEAARLGLAFGLLAPKSGV